MENITMERLINNFTSVINQINDVITRQDKEDAKEILKQIEELVENNEKVQLDDRENYDHVLHELLSNISGKIERKDTKSNNSSITGNEIVSEIEGKLKQLRDEFKKVAEAMKKAREEGNGPEEAFLHKEYNRLTAVIKELEGKLEKAQKIDLKEGQTLEEIKQQLDEEINLNKQEFKKIAEAMKKAREEGNGSEEAFLHKEYNRLTILLNELESKSTNIEELLNEFGNYSTKTPSTVINDNLGIRDEIQKIGDHIFKTAEIRKQLRDRNISREEFLDFYVKSKEEAKKQLDEINKGIDNLKNDVGQIFVTQKGENLLEMLDEKSISDDKKVKILEQIRKNAYSKDYFKRTLDSLRI